MKAWGVAVVLAVVLDGTPVVAQTPDLGSPPSGEVPIIFNDHTVYAKPDVLRRSRVLAALVKGEHLYLPLRSMFEAMGATVSASDGGMTVTAQKAGAMISVTVGKPEVVINGDTRPLDVPPIVYHGIVLVPVRVISEAMGAYVQWLPDRHIVVVRYLSAPVPAPPATPSPVPPLPPPPAPVPTAAPTPSPTPSPASYSVFIQAAMSDARNFNEFSAGQYCDSWLVSGAFAPLNSPIALKVDFRQDSYVTSSQTTDAFANQYTGFGTIDGGYAYVPVFRARQSSFDVRLEYQIAKPRYYVGVGYLRTADNYGYPQLDGFGAGVEKLPDLRPGLSWYGSAFYYPSAHGDYTESNALSPNAGVTYRQEYDIAKYDIGLAFDVRHSPVYLYGGFNADRYYAKQAAPIGQLHDGPYLGLGLKL